MKHHNEILVFLAMKEKQKCEDNNKNESAEKAERAFHHVRNEPAGAVHCFRSLIHECF